MPKDLNKIELHDARLNELSIDYRKRAVSIDVAFYPGTEAAARETAVISFKGVRSIVHSCDLVDLADNASSGNINYWLPGDRGGVTHIYLMNGMISVAATSVSFLVKGADRKT